MAETMFDDLHRVGVAEIDVAHVLASLCNARVLRTADGLPFLPKSRILPTRLAGYLLQELASTFSYFELCINDSSIYDDAAWQELSALTRQIEAAPRYERISYRIERARKFLEYLDAIEEHWSVECRRHGMPDEWARQILHEQLRNKLETDFLRVQQSAERQQARKGSPERAKH